MIRAEARRRPILEYCTPVWSPHHKGLADKIEKVQRRFTKRIYGLSTLSYEDCLLSLKLDSRNSLPYEIANAASISSFRRKLDTVKLDS